MTLDRRQLLRNSALLGASLAFSPGLLAQTTGAPLGRCAGTK